MRLVTGLLVVLATVGTLPLSGQAPPDADGSPGRQPSLTLPAELDRVLRDYERHWSGGAAQELAALFVEDGLIVSGGAWIRGRDAIGAAYANAGGPLRLRAIEYDVSGDVGFIVGEYGYGEELPVETNGMFVLTLRRGSDGRWLIVSDLDRGAG